VKKDKKRLVIIALILLVMLGCVLYAPRYLLFSSPYFKADAIVVFLGPDFSARQKEAYRLINEGMADHMIIPAHHKTYRLSPTGTIQYMPDNSLPRKNGIKNDKTAPRYYEDTHLEVIEAKRIMSNNGLKSAIFVSSPYHMRRIHIMVIREFSGNENRFYFVPTRYENAPGDFWQLSMSDWKKMFREYTKILWFLVYFPWTK
jgi:hypothetical protein